MEKDGLFYMLYTGTCHAERGRIQRIGLAISSDLMRWKRHPGNPVLEAGKMYEEAKDSLFGELAWRDPYVIQHKGVYFALIMARRKEGDPKGRGCIATARSDDLVHWQVGPPLGVPQGFAQMEVPQVIPHKDRFYLLFSAEAGWLADEVDPKVTGTFYTTAPELFGPYSIPKPLLGDHRGSFYAAKLIRTFQGPWVILAWVRTAADGSFVGGLSDPLSGHFQAGGGIEVG
jgi:beta-fructofuranosidase